MRLASYITQRTNEVNLSIRMEENVITELSREELILMGARYRAGYLREQAGYTVGLADAEGQALADLLPQGYLDEVKAAMDAVTAALQDKALVHEEAKEATQANHGSFAQAKVWRRTVARRAACAKRLGKPMPDGLIRITQARTGPALGVQTSEMVKLLEANQEAIPGTGVDQLISDGKALAATLQSVDATKEIKRYSELPNSVQEFYHQKGLLYVGLKAINDAAQALHAGDPVAASRYNLNILHRRGRTQTKPPAPQPTPTPQPTPCIA